MREVSPGVYEASLPRRGVPVNAFVIAGDSLVLVDTGIPGSWKHLFASIREIGREPEEVRFVLISHHHVDHVGSAAAVVEKTGAAVFAHPIEAAILAGTTPPRPKLGRSPVSRLRTSLSEWLGPGPAPPVAVDHVLEDGAEVVGTGLRAIHTPGHTAGHLAFIHPASGALFIGDAAANVLGRLGKPLGDHDEDHEAMMASIRKLAGLDFETAFFGHGRSIKSGARRRLNELAEKLAG